MTGVSVRQRNTPVLFLDLDGTVRESIDDPLGRFVNGPEDVRVFPEARILMERWRQGGGRIVGVTNQGGVALGHLTLAQAVAAVAETQLQTGGMFDTVQLCPHYPNTDDTWARCYCRKPATALALWGIGELRRLHPNEAYPPVQALFVGDRSEDRRCAEALGVNFELASEWRAHASTEETS